MSGPDLRRLVLIHVSWNGGAEHRYSTGYFITDDLVLTVKHATPSGVLPNEIEVRVEDPVLVAELDLHRTPLV